MNQTPPASTGLTVRQAATLVGRTDTDIRDAIARGDLPFSERIVLDRAHVEKWAKRADK